MYDKGKNKKRQHFQGFMNFTEIIKLKWLYEDMRIFLLQPE